MQIPAANLLADRFPRFVGNGRAEVDAVLAEPILRSPGLKTVAQKIELLVRVSPPPVIILAIDNLRLHRMKLQPAFLHARGYRCRNHRFGAIDISTISRGPDLRRINLRLLAE